MNQQQTAIIRNALRLIVQRCPRLRTWCYWAGTAAIAVEELRHRQSFDLDFHSTDALRDVRPILAELQAGFPGAFELTESPNEYGSGFQGVLTLPEGERITVEVLSNHENVSAADLVSAATAPGLKRVTLARYLADIIQCVAERAETRDLADIRAVIRRHPELRAKAKKLLAGQDAALLAERLLSWTDAALAADLAAYDDVAPEHAREARDLLLDWLKKSVARKST